LQALPICQQLFLMNLSPGFHQALLPTWQIASNELDLINSEYRGVILMIGMKMRPTVWSERFHKHPDDDSKEAGNFGHFILLLLMEYYHFRQTGDSLFAYLGLSGSLCQSPVGAFESHFRLHPTHRASPSECTGATETNQAGTASPVTRLCFPSTPSLMYKLVERGPK